MIRDDEATLGRTRLVSQAFLNPRGTDSVARTDGGRIVERWVQHDVPGSLGQLGVV